MSFWFTVVSIITTWTVLVEYVEFINGDFCCWLGAEQSPWCSIAILDQWRSWLLFYVWIVQRKWSLQDTGGPFISLESIRMGLGAECDLCWSTSGNWLQLVKRWSRLCSLWRYSWERHADIFQWVYWTSPWVEGEGFLSLGRVVCRWTILLMKLILCAALMHSIGKICMYTPLKFELSYCRCEHWCKILLYFLSSKCNQISIGVLDSFIT